MTKQSFTDEQLWEMAEKIARNNHFICPDTVYGFLSSNPPEKYFESIADFPNDYLADFLCGRLWEDADFLSQYFDWKQFDAVQWGKLTARFGDKLNGKSDVIPYWGHAEWAYIISMVSKNQLAEIIRECDKWDDFTAREWGMVYGKSSDVDEKISAAIQNFSLQDWYDFLTNCEDFQDFETICPCLNELREKYRYFNDFMPAKE